MGRAGYLRYHRTGDPASLVEAETVLRRALAADSSLVPAAVTLGRVYRETQRAEEAAAILRAAIRRDPTSTEAHQDLGDLYASMDRFDEAEAVFRSLARAKPDYFHAHWRLGWLYRRMNRPDDVLASHTRALALAPGDYRTLSSLGVYYSEMGNWRQAREYWERAFIAHPECATGSNLGSVLYYDGKFNEAAKYYEYALESCDSTRDDHYVNWGNWACALYWTPDKRPQAMAAYARAIELAQAALAASPDDAVTVSRLADYYAMTGRREPALEMIGRAAGISDVEVVYRIACAYASLGDDESALRYLVMASRLHYPLHELNHEPLFSKLVDDPRFRQVVEAAQLDEVGRKQP
jgi:tetratricopeptide (TPR) repeat protein